MIHKGCCVIKITLWKHAQLRKYKSWSECSDIPSQRYLLMIYKSLLTQFKYRNNDRCVSWARSKLTHFGPMFHFYTLWKRPKTKGFLTFSWGIEMERYRLKWANSKGNRRQVTSNVFVVYFELTQFFSF